MNYFETLEEVFKHVVFDYNLLKKVNKYKMGIINKNQEHIEFFSGNLTGVQTLRFAPNKEYIEFFHIFGVTPEQINKAIVASPLFNIKYDVEGDPFNHLCVYVAHRFLTSPKLNKQQREMGAIEGTLIFLIRVVIILINARFFYPANRDVARQVYEELSHKYLIKQYKDWYSVLNYQAEKSCGEDGLHRDRFLKYDEDDGVRYIMTNMQTSLSSLIKGIYAVMMDLNSKKSKIKTGTLIETNMSGELAFKDVSVDEERYVQMALQALPDKGTLIDVNLLSITQEIIGTCDTSRLKEMLGFISRDMYKNPKVKELATEFTKLSILYCISYAKREHLSKSTHNNTGLFLTKIKTGIMSAKSQDSNLLDMRTVGLDLINIYYQKASLQNKSSLRTGFAFYIYLFAHSKINWGGA